MGLGQKILPKVGRVKFLFLESGWVRHLWFGFGKFPSKIPIFSIFCPLDLKNLSGLGQTYPGQSRVSLLFTVGQKYARVMAHL